jgi:hypothetical protein
MSDTITIARESKVGIIVGGAPGSQQFFHAGPGMAASIIFLP